MGRIAPFDRRDERGVGPGVVQRYGTARAPDRSVIEGQQPAVKFFNSRRRDRRNSRALNGFDIGGRHRSHSVNPEPVRPEARWG